MENLLNKLTNHEKHDEIKGETEEYKRRQEKKLIDDVYAPKI